MPADRAGQAQLLAELIGGDGAGQIARRLLAQLGSLSRVMAASPAAIARAGGEPDAGQRIAAARAVVLAGQRELVARATFDLNDPCLRRFVGGLFQGLAVEQLHAFFLDAQSGYIADERIGEGGCSQVAWSLRGLVSRALDLGASGVVLAHNHPSGSPEPSAQDIAVTRRIAASLGELELTLADHIIVGGTTIFSMRGAELL